MKLAVVLLVACACAAVQARSLQQATMNDPRLTTFNRALKVRLYSRRQVLHGRAQTRQQQRPAADLCRECSCLDLPAIHYWLGTGPSIEQPMRVFNRADLSCSLRSSH